MSKHWLRFYLNLSLYLDRTQIKKSGTVINKNQYKGIISEKMVIEHIELPN